MDLKRVVVTGIGALTPLGKTLDEYWEGLTNGVSGADFIKQFDCSKFKTRFACEVKDFDPTVYLDRKEARKIDRFTQFALVVSDQAVELIAHETVRADERHRVDARDLHGLFVDGRLPQQLVSPLQRGARHAALRAGISGRCTALDLHRGLFGLTRKG